MRKDTGKTTERLQMSSVAYADEMAGEVGGRIAHWLRQRFPGDTAKNAARAFGCSPRTVEGWLAGNLPLNRHLIMMIAAWGQRFVAFIFEPATGTSMAAYQLDQEFHELKARMQALEGALNAATQNEDRALAVQTRGRGDESGVTAR